VVAGVEPVPHRQEHQGRHLQWRESGQF
jgi:hypothetical protein